MSIDRVFCLVACLLASTALQADIYYRDDGGVPVFSDQPDRSGFTLFLHTRDLPATSLSRLSSPGLIAARMQTYSPMIETAARQHDLEPALLHAIIMVESGYDPAAKSPKGAVGLMQLMPDTAQRYGSTDRQDPGQNIKAGARYLADLLSQFRGDLSLAVAAYNAGENAVRRSGMRIPPYRETQRYVPAVLARYNWLRNRG